jgi:hypothetical protein
MIPGVAGAGEATVGAKTKLGYDSNVFARGDPDDIDSAVWSLEAWGQVKDELERGDYRVRYSPTYFVNTAKQADNTWNQTALAEGTWRFSPQTSVRVWDDFAYLEKIVFAPDDADTDPNIDNGNKKTIRNTVASVASHAFTRRISGYAGGDYTIYRFSRSQDEDNDAFSGYSGLNYALTKQWRAGFGGQVSYRSFDSEQNNSATFCAGENGPGSRTFSYSGFVLAGYQFDENTTVEARAGPARIETTDWVCTGAVYESRNVNQTTWFAQGELLRKWTRYIDTSVRYNRSEGLGGVGTTTVNDVLTARLHWVPARFWDVNLRAGWIRRTQDAARNPTTRIKTTTDTTTWTVAGSVSRQVLRRLRAGVEASYRKQNASEDVSNPLNLPPTFFPQNKDVSDFDVYRVFAFLTYELDPFRY